MHMEKQITIILFFQQKTEGPTARGGFNTASGSRALAANTTGGFNTASGTSALGSNTDRVF